MKEEMGGGGGGGGGGKLPKYQVFLSCFIVTDT